jgi:hypothetical protein
MHDCCTIDDSETPAKRVLETSGGYVVKECRWAGVGDRVGKGGRDEEKRRRD